MFKFIVFTVLIILVMVGFLFFSISKGSGTVQQLVSSQHEKIPVAFAPTPNPTPTPFYDLTIPYLREREYKSTLDKLEKVSENLSYTSYLTSYTSDGLKINGLLTVPTGHPSTHSVNSGQASSGQSKPSGRWPAVVFVHGYIPPAEYQTLTRYEDHVDYLARNGLVVFKIDLRGHGSSEGESGGVYYSSDYVIDVLNAYAALQSSDLVDPKKIGLWGHSMAGNMVFRSFVAKQTIPAAVIWSGAVYTYSDFSQFSIEDNSYQPPPPQSESRRKREQLFETYGQFDPQDSFWKQIVPTNYLSGVDGALQINHAVNDDVVSIGYSRNLMRILDGTSIVHELHELPSGGHNITGSSFTEAMQKTVDFFKKNLGD